MNGTRLIRAAITEAEWTRLRKRAIDRGVNVSQLVAEALREQLAKPVSK